MSEKRVSKPVAGIAIAGLIVGAALTVDQNAKDAERKAAKVTLQVTSDGTQALMAYGIGKVPGPKGPITLKRDEAIDTNVWRDTVIVPKGTRVFLVTERVEKNNQCWVIYQGRVENTNSTLATGQATCVFFVPR